MKESAGLLMFRFQNKELEFFLAHPGGPYFKNKDLGSWTIPKGEVGLNEDKLDAAKREFYEETGLTTDGPFIDLGIAKQTSKIIHAWAFEGNWNELNTLVSNEFEIEWPPKSGKKQKFPEVDQVKFFTKDQAKDKIIAAQYILITRLEELLNLNK